MSARPKVLVAEKIADSGIDALREHFDVDLGNDWTREQLEERIGDYDGLLIRSATKVDAGLIARADRLKVVGRAGIGVDNVDVAAATKRGIVVANAPQSNIVTAAEHTIALLLALARNVPQAHASLTGGKWERSKFGGVELYEKTLGVLGFGRIGRLVAERAKGLGMHVIAFDPFISAELFQQLGVEKAESSDQLYATSDFITIHLPRTAETRGWLDAAAFAKCKHGVRIVNCARGELIVEEDLKAALDAGQVAGAALDVFQQEPITEHPLFGDPRVVVTPHLGASTVEAQDRAGIQTAEQVIAALTGGTVTTAVNAPAVAPEDREALGPFIPLCEQLGKIGMALAERSSVEQVEIEVLGRIAERDTRILTIATLKGALQAHTDDEVNDVNAPSIAEEHGIAVSETKNTHARDFTDLIRVTIFASGERNRVVGTVLGRRHRPHLLEAWGQRFNLQLERHLVLFRYSDVPGMIGRIGTAFGAHGINITSAAVGRQPGDDGPGAPDGLAAMAITTDVPVPQSVVDELVTQDGFVAGRAVSL